MPPNLFLRVKATYRNKWKEWEFLARSEGFYYSKDGPGWTTNLNLTKPILNGLIFDFENFITWQSPKDLSYGHGLQLFYQVYDQ